METDLDYDGLTPISVRVTRRDGRYLFSDEGGAVAAAGVDPAELSFPDRIPLGQYSVNVSKQGVAWLPAFASQGEAWLERVATIVAEGSLVLYESLLSLED